MIAFLLQLVTGLMSWLSDVLPASPFSDIVLALDGVGQAIGWLNWLVPVTDMAALFGVWLLAAAIWQVVNFVLKRFSSTLSIFGGAKA